MDEIIKSLALSAEYEEEAAADLWNALFGELDARHLNPREIPDTENPRQPAYEMDAAKGRKILTFQAFAAEVSRLRRGAAAVE